MFFFQVLNEMELVQDICYDGDAQALREKVGAYGVDAVHNAFYNGLSCLYQASQFNADPSLVWYLLVNGADPNAVGHGRWGTALVGASHHGMLPIMDILMAYGANASIFHSNALRESFSGAYDFQRKVAKKLLENGADPNAADPDSDDESMRRSPFMNAVFWARLGLVREMAKWMDNVPNIEVDDVSDAILRRRTSRRKFLELINEEIELGRRERQVSLGKLKVSNK